MSEFFDSLRSINDVRSLDASHQTLVDLFSIFAVVFVVTFILSFFVTWALPINLFSIILYFIARWRWYKHRGK